MTLDPRLTVSISSPRLENLSKPQRRFLDALQERIERAGLRVIPDSTTNDNVECRLNKIRRCQGVAVLAFSQWEAERIHRRQDRTIVLPAEFSHMTAVMAVAARRPLLVLREKSVAERGAFRGGYVTRIVKVPDSLRTDWLDEPDFAGEFKGWINDVQCFRHVFLGYSKKAETIANSLYKFLTENLKLRVYDWRDFGKREDLWENIERAERETSCGVFLFMADDELATRDPDKAEYAPRDNVVYEAGYFAGAKGRKQTLIIRQERARMPSDLGGILYLNLPPAHDIAPMESELRRYFEDALSDQV